MKNYFLKNKDPSKWDLKTALHFVEKDQPLKTQRQCLATLKTLLTEASHSGTIAQKKSAQEILDDWKIECSRLTDAGYTRHNTGEGAMTSSGTMTVTYHFYGNGNVVNHSASGTPETGNRSLKRQNSSNESSSSWKSADPHPRRRQHRLYLSGQYLLDSKIECTLLPLPNIAVECEAYRRNSIKGAQDRESLCDARILSLSFIFLVSKTEKCFLTPLRHQEAILRPLRRNEGLLRVDASVITACKQVVDLYDDGAPDTEITDTLTSIAAHNNETTSPATAILKSITGRFQQWETAAQDGREEDLIKSRLQYLVEETVGKIGDTCASWSTYTLKPHPTAASTETFLPDYVLYNCKVDSRMHYELLCIEVKSKSKNKYESDLVRLGKQLKLMLDKLAIRGVRDPVVVGILVCGLSIKFYKMFLAGSGLYCFVELAALNLMREPTDLVLIPSLVERFYQVKQIASSTIDKLYQAVEEGSLNQNRNTNQLQALLKPSCTAPVLQEGSRKRKKGTSDV